MQVYLCCNAGGRPACDQTSAPFEHEHTARPSINTHMLKHHIDAFFLCQFSDDTFKTILLVIDNMIRSKVFGSFNFPFWRMRQQSLI